jgi:hypothetical protein
MAGFTYICFVFAASVIGAVLGGLGHFWRANATMYAEDLGLGEPLDTPTRDNYQFEKNVVGAEWDDAGFWAADSVRNFVYYVISGFITPLLLGIGFWDLRGEIVQAVCGGLAGLGLNSPICP